MRRKTKIPRVMVLVGERLVAQAILEAVKEAVSEIGAMLTQ